MFIKKPIASLLMDVEEGGLKRSLSSLSLIGLGIGAVIGAGLFSLTGIVAAENAGPAVTISFIIAAVCCLFTALCYAEFSSMIPISGSAYTYSYASLGELVAWIIGWDLVLEYSLAAATVAVSWSQYFANFLNRYNIDFIPNQLLSSPFDTLTLNSGEIITDGIINLPAVFIVMSLSLVLIKGTKGSALMNSFLVILKMAVVFIFICVGWNYINPVNHTPFIIPNEAELDVVNGTTNFFSFFSSKQFGEYGWSGIMRGAAVVFFAYVGFDAVSTAAQEAKNPKKGMPIGIIGSLVICTVLYVLFSYVMTGLAHYTDFKGDASPVATAISYTPYSWLQDGVIIAILAGYTSVILVMLLGQSRVFYAMSRDGLLPKMFSELHTKNSTPWKANIFFMCFVSLFAGFVPISDLGHMVSIGTLFAFILVCIGILVMRKTMPNVPREFKTPLVPLIPILGIISCLLMMLSLPKESWLRLAIWISIGLIIYFAYGIHNSKLRIQQKDNLK